MIAICLEKDYEKISGDSKFGQDLGADDLDMWELTSKIEGELGISIPDEVLCGEIENDVSYNFKIKTVNELFDLCHKYLR